MQRIQLKNNDECLQDQQNSSDQPRCHRMQLSYRDIVQYGSHTVTRCSYSPPSITCTSLNRGNKRIEGYMCIKSLDVLCKTICKSKAISDRDIQITSTVPAALYKSVIQPFESSFNRNNTYVCGIRRFGRDYCLHLQGSLKRMLFRC